MHSRYQLNQTKSTFLPLQKKMSGRQSHTHGVLKNVLSKPETQHVNSMTRSCTPKESLLFQCGQILGSVTLNDWLDSSQNSFTGETCREKNNLGCCQFVGIFHDVKPVWIRCKYELSHFFYSLPNIALLSRWLKFDTFIRATVKVPSQICGNIQQQLITWPSMTCIWPTAWRHPGMSEVHIIAKCCGWIQCHFSFYLIQPFIQ